MGHTPKKRKSPPKMLRLPDHDLMEAIIGKRAMKEVDLLVSESSEGVESKEETKSMKES